MAGLYDIDAVRVPNGSYENGFLVRLIHLDDDLGEKDIEGIKFLCCDVIPGSRLEKCRKGIEIFQYLIERKLITEENIDLLVECLCRINRLDWIKKLNFKPDDVKQKVNTATTLNPFRVMLFNIAEDISVEEVSKIRYYLQNIVSGHQSRNISSCTTMVEAFTFCEKMGLLDETNIQIIYEMLKILKRDDLVDEVDDYAEKTGLRQSPQCLSDYHIQNQVNRTGSSSIHVDPMEISESSQRLGPVTVQPFLHGNSMLFPHPENTQPGCIPNRGLSVAPLTYDVISALNTNVNYELNTSGVENTYGTSQNPPCQFRNEASSTLELEMGRRTPIVAAGVATGFNYSVPHRGSQVVPSGAPIKHSQEQTELLERYKMDAEPRGICLIINNKKFFQEENDPRSRKLEDREGTDVDCEKLQNLFSKLHFKVEIQCDQTDQQIRKLMIDTSRKDHSEYDCFVCCVLTHGTEGNILGSNGKEIPILNLTCFFRSDFCPSLAGKPKVFFFQACQGSEKQSGYKMEQALPDIVEDAPTREMIPNEADFLFGFATVAGYSSYRSRSKGSWYINKLVQMLETYHERIDVLSILVRVNDAVCKGDAHFDSKVYKQTPAPMFTLRKQLYF
ncbi:hypothetical protein CHS0354_021095 [Potamilus streckersoni]|uniref:Caspase-8 n=1 Tax=Potamilus streckersoni TaxID=2493646 RepID=A0AAE0SDA0_9BIVA|nr:hypothetical protein CHS0354_021095 [Potamilus streckersoni]